MEGLVQEMDKQDAKMFYPLKIVQGRAFVYPGFIEGKPVLGNPASIVICNDHFPARERMREIAIQEASPMTAFIRKRADDHFDINYFTPSGNEFVLCGHATLIAANYIYSHMGEGNVYFHREGIEMKLEAVSRINDNGSQYTYLTMPAYTPVTMPEEMADRYLALLSLDRASYKGIYVCNELDDLIVVLNNSDALRNAVPKLDALAADLIEDKLRGVFVTAASEVEDMDYEVRIFSPHNGINEDISCGSANCSLLPLWHQLLGTPASYQFRILCPYHVNAGELGGVESGSYDEKKGVVYIGGIIGK